MMKIQGPPRMATSKKAGKKGGIAQFAIPVLVLVVVVVIIVIMASGGKKKPRSVRREGGTLTQLAQGRERVTRERTGSARVRARESREERKSERREERRRLREERKAKRRERSRRKGETGERTTIRSSRGGYTTKQSGVPVLKAIISEPTGERMAIVGERRVKKGDQIEGRRIIDVEQDRVKVEYLTKSYEVKINQPLY